MPGAARSKSRIVKPLRGGQITIPAEFREKLGIAEDTLLSITLEGDELHLRKIEVKETAKGSPWLRKLYEMFAPVRQDMAAHSEQETDAAIDQAIRQVRRKRHA